MKKLSIGITAHVDAGKTTLTESMLFLTGMIRDQGRVDMGNAFLDTEQLEKKRGVTIYSKQAILNLPAGHPMNMSGEDIKITLIDTPGHADFIGETERSMSVMDLCVLMISAPDGVTDSVRRLKTMLAQYHVPYLVYVNKTDMVDEDSLVDITQAIKKEFGAGAIPVNIPFSGEVLEDIASLSEDTIERFLETGTVSKDDIISLIYSGVFHPVLFGSALKNTGTDGLIRLMTGYAPDIRYRDEFGAKVFKIVYEEGHKFSFVKITGGSVNVRDSLPDERLGSQKITQIRCYSGGRYDTVDRAEAGDVVTLCGPEDSFVGMGIGAEPDESAPINRPVLRYDMILPDDVPVRVFMPKLKELAAQDPLLAIDAGDGSVYGDRSAAGVRASLQGTGNNSVRISVMGDFQLEIIAQTIEERFGIRVTFSPGRIIYKETIADAVVGFGHFEPLRHYAEVQLLLEPLPEGSGIETGTALSVNELGINWQKTILSTLIHHLPAGVLTCSALTDLKITLIGGRSHTKHSESTDFAEAARRAVRQALMKTDSILLEPYYSYSITLPTENLGRAMNDMSMMNGTSRIVSQDEGMSVIEGRAPTRMVYHYQSELTAYTSGRGTITFSYDGYSACSDEHAQSVIEETGYDPDTDSANLSGSVFIDHGAGYYVPWYECEQLMHTESRENEFLYGEEISEEDKLEAEAELAKRIALSREHAGEGRLAGQLYAMGTDEIDEIISKTTGTNTGTRKGKTKRVYHQKRVISARPASAPKNVRSKPKYLLVDGYNIIHAWDELKSLLTGETGDLDGAKYRLLDILSEYRVLKGTEIIAVFDAYRVKGHITEKIDYMGVHVVYTREAETADQYIARFTVQNSKEMDITVATSDGLVQLIILGENARLMSARELKDDIALVRKESIEGNVR